MSQRIVPSFLLAWAGKCGSSSLYKYLLKHTDIFLPAVKELHYFWELDISKKTDINNIRYADNYEKYMSGQYLPSTVILDDIKDYMHFFKWSDEFKVVGECSPSYLYSDTAAEQIHEHNKNMKLLFIVRDPVARAISHYKMLRRLWAVTVPLMDIVDNFTWYTWFSHKEADQILWYGFYATQLQKYYELFAKENMLVVLQDDLKNTPQKVMDEVFSFLDLDTIVFDDFKVYNKWINTYYSPKYVWLKRMIWSLWGNLITKNSFIVIFLKRFVKPLFTESFNISPHDLQKIYALYKNDINLLEDMLWKKLSNWKKYV